MRVERIETLDELAHYAERWDDLAGSLPQGLPMLTHGWIATYLEQKVRAPSRWVCFIALDGETVAGVLPAVLEPKRILGVPRPRAFVPFDYHTDEGDVLLRPGHDGALGALLAALRSEARIAYLELGGVRDNSPTRTAVDAGVPGWSVAGERAVDGSSLAIDGDFETWQKSISKNLRSDMRRAENRIRKGGREPAITFLAGPEATPDHLGPLMRLEASGWKGSSEDGTAIATDAGSVAKYEALARRFHERGILEWHSLRLGDRLAAAHMAVRLGRNLMLLRHAYDDELKRFGAGNLLLRAAIEREFRRGGGSEINLVTDYPWCRRWRMKLSGYHRLRLCPHGPLPWLGGVLPIRLRKLARRVPGLRALKKRLDG